MSKAKRERSPLYPKILFGFTDHPITVWAGVILLRVYFEWIKLREELNEALVNFGKRSNNQISSVEVMLSWFYGLALGAERFEHFTRYRRDRLLGELLGIKRYGSPDTMRRLFLRFNYQKVTEVSERLMGFSLSRSHPILLGHTLDLDSTVFCRYGEQEGSLKGYNPSKPGRPSHHPLMAFLAEARRLLWARLRSRNSGSANGCVEFMKQALSVVPMGHRIGLVRADAGFFEKRFLEYLESQELPYIIVARWRAIHSCRDLADCFPGLAMPGNGATLFQRKLSIVLSHRNTLYKKCCTSFVNLGNPGWVLVVRSYWTRNLSNRDRTTGRHQESIH